MSESAVTVTREEAPDRFEIRVDGAVAGFTQFLEVESQRIFFHTEIGEEFGGQGLAGKLVKQALEQTRADGKRIVPVCPYVKGYLQKNSGSEDITDPVRPEAIELVEKHLA